MDTEILNFLKGLTHEDAIQAFTNAKQESGREGIHFKDTKSYQKYLQTCEMILAAINEYTLKPEETLDITASEWVVFNQKRKALFGNEVLRFVYAKI